MAREQKRQPKRLTILELVTQMCKTVLGPEEFGFVFSSRDEGTPFVVLPEENLYDEMEKTDAARVPYVLREGGEVIVIKLGRFSRNWITDERLDDVAQLFGRAFEAGMLYERKVEENDRSGPQAGPPRLAQKGDFEQFR